MRHRDFPLFRAPAPAHVSTLDRLFARPVAPCCAVALLLLLPALAPAQQGPAPDAAVRAALARADSAFQAERWDDADVAYQAVLRHDSTAAMAWYRLGRVRFQQERHREALELFDAAERHGFAPLYIRFGKARALTALGEEGAAVAELAAAADNGFGAAGAITEDPDLAPLMDHPDMEAVLATVARNSEPCRHSEEARQLDFWIGTWDVYNPRNGQKMGVNVVEPTLKGCALIENWTGAGGSSGKSLNFFDPQRKTWRQVWVSDLQNVLDYRHGEFRDGAMRFSGMTLDPAGDTTLQKLTFVDVAPDTVRQVFESSSDGGQTWSTDWVGIYVRRTPEAAAGGQGR